MQSWTMEQKSQVASAIPRLRKMLEEASDFLKESLREDPESVPGFRLKDTGSVTSITNPQELHSRFCSMGGTTEQFMCCVKIVKGELEKQIRSVKGLKGAALEREVEKTLEGITETKPKEPSIAPA